MRTIRIFYGWSPFPGGGIFGGIFILPDSESAVLCGLRTILRVQVGARHSKACSDAGLFVFRPADAGGAEEFGMFRFE
jgi:hypothetical protein